MGDQSGKGKRKRTPFTEFTQLLKFHKIRRQTQRPDRAGPRRNEGRLTTQENKGQCQESETVTGVLKTMIPRPATEDSASTERPSAHRERKYLWANLETDGPGETK